MTLTCLQDFQADPHHQQQSAQGHQAEGNPPQEGIQGDHSNYQQQWQQYYYNQGRAVTKGNSSIIRAPPLGGCPIVITLSVLLSVLLSVCLSVCPSKNFNIGHNFFTLRDRSFIFGMCDPYDKAFPTVP